MKPNRLVILFFIFSIVSACSMPVGTSLLVNEGVSCDSSTTDCDPALTSDPGGLEIQANSSTLSLAMEDGEMLEVTGSCKDLGRQNNRILVEVYAGEDESSDPYISNAISDSCYASKNPTRSGLETVFLNPRALTIGTTQSYAFSASGGTAPYTYTIAVGSGTINAGTGLYLSGALTGTDIVQVTDATGATFRGIVTVLSGVTTPIVTTDNKKCFVVTKGVGRVEDAGLPNERTFPQCHNGQFGFSVRLGKVLVNPTSGQPNFKYLVRYKLRTQEGAIADSAWSRITVDRNLTTPIINSATPIHASQKCTIKSSSARFNPAILYTLNRTFTDVLAANAGSTNLFVNANTLGVVTGSSVSEWDDVGLTDGVTYNYTLTSLDASYGYSIVPTLSSNVVSCTTKRIYIKLSQQQAAGTCYFSLLDTGTAEQITTFNPYVTYEWGYSTTAGWIGASGEANSGYTASSCGNTAVCTQSGLATGSTYFFALRAKNLVRGEVGKWSPVVPCTVSN